jgi:hypothetical protein
VILAFPATWCVGREVCPDHRGDEDDSGQTGYEFDHAIANHGRAPTTDECSAASASS